MRRIKLSFRWTVFAILMITLLVSVGIYTILWIITEKNRNEQVIEEFRELSLDDQRLKVQLEVERAIDYIEFQRVYHNSETEASIQNEILDYLAQIRFGYAGYIFVNQFDGQPLIFDGKRVLEKRDISDMTDPTGKRVFDLELEAAHKPDGGFIEYLFKKIDSDIAEPKLSFIKGIPDWGWIIGAGDYLNDVEHEVQIKASELNRRLNTKIERILLVLIIFTFLILLTAIGLSKILDNQLRYFTNFFEKRPDEAVSLNPNKFIFKELAELGTQANKMVEQNDAITHELVESKAKLEEAQSIAKVGSWELHPKNGKYFWSAEMFRIHNLEPSNEPPSEQEYYKMVHPDDLDALKKAQREALESKSSHGIVFRTNPELGKMKYLLASTKLEIDDSGEPFFSGTVTDITEIQLAKMELEESRASYKFLVENVSSVIWHLDSNFNTIFISPSVEKMLGYKPEEFSKLRLKDIHPKKELSRVWNAMRKRLEDEAEGIYSDEAEIAEFQYKTKDKRDIIVEVRGVPLRGKSGELNGFLLSLVDVTAQRLAEADNKILANRNKQILSNSLDGYLLTDEAGWILEVNDAYCTMSGFSRKELLTMHISDLETNPTEEEMDARISKIIEDGGGRFEAKHIRKDGTIMYVELSNSLAPEDDRILVATFIRDITTTKELTLQLQSQILRLEVLVELSTKLNAYPNYQQIGDEVINAIENKFGWKRASIWLLSGDKEEIHLLAHSRMGLTDEEFIPEFDRINKLVAKPGDGIVGWVALYGRPINSGDVQNDIHYIPADVNTHSALCVPIKLGHDKLGALNVESYEYNAFSAEDEQMLTIIANQAAVALHNVQSTNELQQELVDHEQAEIELERVKKNLEKEVEERTNELKKQYEDIHKSVQAMSFMNEDIKRAKDELENVNNKLKESNKNLEDFAHMVSHDLKAPLNQINIFAQALKKEHEKTLTEDGLELVDDMLTSCKNMNSLINAILDFSRATKRQIECVNIDMGELFTSIFNEQVKLTKSKNIKFEIVNNTECYADYVLMKQIAHNLIGNALKFTANERQPKIKFSAEKEDGQVIYCIQDNGVGFDSKHAEFIFNSFTRSHSASEFKGTGIGLSIVKKIIERHGGKVWAEGELNKGAKIYFSLPQAKAS